MAIHIDGLIEQEWKVPIPLPLNNWIDIRTKVVLSERIRHIFSDCCFWVQEKIINDKIERDFHVTIIFDSHCDLHITTTGGKFLGTQFSAIIYPVQDWIDEGLNERTIAVSIIEEMCHYFWNIHDEWEVQRYVVDVYKLAFPKDKVRYPYKDRKNKELLSATL